MNATVAAQDWRSLARCRDVDGDGELFFPTAERGREFDRQVAAAKSVCRRCPVRAQCLSFALRALPEGIAGGLTPAERRGMARRNGVEPATWDSDLPVAASSRRGAAAGAALLAQGKTPRDVARACGVTERTALRWAARARAAA